MRSLTPADPQTWQRFMALLAQADEPTKAVVREMIGRWVPLAEVMAEMERRAS